MKNGLAFVCAMAAYSVWAGWNGVGVPGGTGGAAINDAANWAGGVIDGDFSGITAEGTTALVLTNDLAFADGTAKTLASTELSFASNATDIAFTSTNGLAVGQLVNGVGLQTNTFLVALSETNGTLSRFTTGLPSGSYMFARPAMSFDFGLYGTRATNIKVTVSGDALGTPRVLTLSGRLCQSPAAVPTNQVVFSPDVVLNCTNGAVITREGGIINTNTVQPAVIVNGPVLLGDFGAATTRLTLDGGDLAINGLVSGANAGLNVYSNATAGTLTLTCPSNTFSGGLTSQGGGRLVASSDRVFAGTGVRSALGSGGTISLNNTTYVLQGFTERQITDRSWNVGGKLSLGCWLYTYGSAPVELAGLIRNDVAVEDCPFYLYSSYQNRGTPNVVSGFIRVGSKVLAVGVSRGTWRLTNPTNTFNGSLRTSGSDGATLQLTSLSNSGTPSAGGAGSLVYLESAGASATAMNVFEYIGTNNASCNRELRATGNASDNCNNALTVNGLGSLTLTGLFSNSLNANWGFLQYRTIHFLGTGTGRFSGTGSLGDVSSGSNTGRINIVKGGSGTWTLSGTNLNHQGYTEARAGNLILDYTAYDQFSAAAPGTVRTGGGTMTFKAKPSGVTADTLGTFQFGASGSQYKSSKLMVDANGGDGFALTVQTLSGDDLAQKFELVDLSSSSGNSVTANALGWKLNVVNGVLMNYASSTADTAARSTIVLRTVDGYGFPCLSGGGSGVLQRLSALQVLPTSGYVVTNYVMNSAETIAPAADVNFSTLTVETTAGAPTLALGARKIACNGAGRGILLSGPNDATISGTGTASHVSAGSLWFHNYLAASATLHADLNLGVGGPHVLWGGTGFAVYTGIGLGNNFHLAGGVFRMTAPQALTFPGKVFVLASGGVFEIGADLNGASAGDFSFSLGVPGSATTTTVALYGDTGLSASGADRVVNFGGAGATLTWGASHFLTFFDGAMDYGYAFKLSSPYADATVEVQNPVDLNGKGLHGRVRTVDVANGSAAVDARLSGALSGNATLAKSGAGTLELTGKQGYDGPLLVMDGFVKFGADNIATNALAVQLRGGGLAAGNGSNSFGPLELYANAVIDVGSGAAPLAFSNSSGCAWFGSLTITGTLLPNTLRFGTDETGLTVAQVAAIRNGADKVRIDANGYLHRIPAGSVILLL